MMACFSPKSNNGVYCRPVCPVRPAKARNVSFYLSAAAGPEPDGFRPCLRCRPEAAPFSPAWKGSRTTVERAIRLIGSGALDDATVEVLAERLGVGSRHLSRLFTRHLGASPTQVARTARVQRAKRLLHETDLPMSEIAFRSGFRSLRRFNTVFAEVYQRSPTVLRRARLALMVSGLVPPSGHRVWWLASGGSHQALPPLRLARPEKGWGRRPGCSPLAQPASAC